MSDGPEIVGRAVLRDFPLRIWHRQQDHRQELIREFQLLVAPGTEHHDVPERLLEMAEMFNSRYSALLDAITAERQQAYDAGLTRFDSVVPLPAETPQLIRQAQRVLAEVDDYCRAGELLTLATPPDVLAFREWSTSEILRQYRGEDPIPWTGPFD